MTFSWPQLGASGLLALVIYMIISGWLVPRRTLRDAQEQRDKWEAAWRESHAAGQEQARQIDELAELGRTTTTLLNSIVSSGDQRKAN